MGLGQKQAFKTHTPESWLNPDNGHNAVLTGYAYETIANKAIIAGKTKGPDVITIQPDTLGQLALGRK